MALLDFHGVDKDDSYMKGYHFTVDFPSTLHRWVRSTLAGPECAKAGYIRCKSN